MSLGRFGRFSSVGALGVLVQLGVVSGLTTLRLAPGPATAAAVAVALLHNFVWHWAWTWEDRRADLWPALWRFVVTSGLVSLTGNVIVSLVLAGALNWPVTGANAVGIATCGIVNYLLADRAAFRGGQARS